jgi:hypothetical protein
MARVVYNLANRVNLDRERGSLRGGEMGCEVERGGEEEIRGAARRGKRSWYLKVFLSYLKIIIFYTEGKKLIKFILE